MRRRIPRVTLARKIFLATLAYTALLVSVLALVAGFWLRRELEEQFVLRGLALTRHLAREAFLAAYVQKRSDLSLLAEGALGEDVRFVQVVKDGEVIAYKGASVTPQDLPPPPERPGIVRRQLPDGTDYLDILLPLVEQAPQPPSAAAPAAAGAGTGMRVPPSYARLAMSLAYIDYERRQLLGLIAAAGAASVLAGVGLAASLYRSILRPLQHVVDAVRRFGAGERSARASLATGDELEWLAGAFNEMADATESATRRLEEANRAKSEFIAAMGHDLRTPLFVLMGYLQLLQEEVAGPLSPRQRAYVASAEKAAEHLKAFLEAILAFARLESGQERLDSRPVDASAVVQEVGATFAALAGEKGVHLGIEAGGPVSVVADPTKLRQIVANLVANAVKFTPPGGTVRIRCREVGGGMELSVEDTGPGLLPEDRERIFEPFVQLDAGQPPDSQRGLGLGLAIVRRYVELHAGSVNVESEPGRGSRFTVWLPRVPPQRVEPSGR